MFLASPIVPCWMNTVEKPINKLKIHIYMVLLSHYTNYSNLVDPTGGVEKKKASLTLVRALTWDVEGFVLSPCSKEINI